jgi:hypothetical protein
MRMPTLRLCTAYHSVGFAVSPIGLGTNGLSTISYPSALAGRTVPLLCSRRISGATCANTFVGCWGNEHQELCQGPQLQSLRE